MAIEAVDSRARGLGRRRDDVQGALAVVRRLDWILLAAVGVTLAYGLIAIDGITQNDPGGSALMRQSIYADRKSTRLNSSHTDISRMPSSA